MTPHAPLAERLRPTTLDDLVGQQHLVGPQGPLRQLVQQGRLPSMLLWGPPGVGKTTLAVILARTLQRPFEQLSAVSAGVKEVRAVLELARLEPGMVLFIDEIHRFNKSQQDALLQAVEQGLVTLIGATTENPSFEVIPALRSRCQLYVLYELGADEILLVLQRALALLASHGDADIVLQEWDALYRLSGGDGRKALNLLELVVGYSNKRPLHITDALTMQVAQQRIAQYDKGGEQHYDVISAFIKSIRGSDPNAALYYMARMLHGGEDIRFIARRMVILASEDIGNANPNALLLATATFQAIEMIGMPEARIILAQCATYLATSLKSNASYAGIDAALALVRSQPDLPVPLHLRNAPTKLMKDLDYGKNYKYSHAHFDAAEDMAQGNQEFLPEAISGTKFYQPKPIGKEKELLDFLKRMWATQYGY